MSYLDVSYSSQAVFLPYIFVNKRFIYITFILGQGTLHSYLHLTKHQCNINVALRQFARC